MTETSVDTPPPALPLRKRLERNAGRAAMRLLVGPIRALPLPLAQVVGRGIGGLTYCLLGRYRRVAHKNLALIYGKEKSVRERARMARAVFTHFGQMGTEFIKLPSLSPEKIESLVTIEGEEHVQAALAMQAGVLLITGHFGNWELLARWMADHHYPLNVVARDARDPMATKLLTDTRERNGTTVLFRGNSARAVLQCLKKKEAVAILPDQNAADVFVPFLGVPTGTVDGPAIIHLKTGAPMVMCYCVRQGNGRFFVHFDPPLVISPTGDRTADIAQVMSAVNGRLGEWIRLYPTQWLWLHNRWKASPGVFPDGAENARELKLPMKKYAQETANHRDTADR